MTEHGITCEKIAEKFLFFHFEETYSLHRNFIRVVIRYDVYSSAFLAGNSIDLPALA